jgi:hypothetical protein
MTVLNEVDFQSGQVLAFKATDAELSRLREHFGIVPSVETKEGYQFVKEGVRELVTLRTSLESERKRIKQPYLDAGRIIDDEAKRITAELIKIETPMKLAKKEMDDREALQKAERLRTLQAMIEGIKQWERIARGKSSAEIAEIIEKVDGIDTSKLFFELTLEATTARSVTLDALNVIYAQQITYDIMEKERAAAEEELKAVREKQAAERAEQARKEAEAAAEIQALKAQQAAERAEQERKEAAAAAELQTLKDKMAAQEAEQKRKDDEADRLRLKQLQEKKKLSARRGK